MIDERDAMIDRVVDALRPLPDVDDSAKARLLIAVAAERERERESALRRPVPRRGSRWVVRVSAVAAAAALFGVILLRTPREPVAVSTAAAPRAPTPSVRLAGSDAASSPEGASQSVEFVLRAPAAATVRVVGDFNGWDQGKAPMTRDIASGLWSITLSLRPGRHIYAFVIDDSVWMRDPRAPAARDADFGRPGSVLLVGRP
ncbi:hypothetical protein BH11GEM1_BH11GEM1_14540 [soil metagenome]